MMSLHCFEIVFIVDNTKLNELYIKNYFWSSQNCFSVR